MGQSTGPDGSTAWIDERRLGRYVRTLYGRDAESVEISLVRLLAAEGLGDLYRRERYREDGARIGPDLKVPLETAALVLEVFAAAHHAALRAIALHEGGAPLRFVRMEDLLGLMIEAGCDPPDYLAC